jgi:hypothetical protein
MNIYLKYLKRMVGILWFICVMVPLELLVLLLLYIVEVLNNSTWKSWVIYGIITGLLILCICLH